MRHLIAVIVLLAGCSHAFSYGAIVKRISSTYNFSFSNTANKTTPEEAVNAGKAICDGATKCEIIGQYSNICVAIAEFRPSYAFGFGYAAGPLVAEKNALAMCAKNSFGCMMTSSICDTTSGVSAVAPAVSLPVFFEALSNSSRASFYQASAVSSKWISDHVIGIFISLLLTLLLLAVVTAYKFRALQKEVSLARSGNPYVYTQPIVEPPKPPAPQPAPVQPVEEDIKALLKAKLSTKTYDI